MSQLLRALSIVTAAGVISACSPPPSAPAAPPDTTADVAAIGALRSNFEAAIASGDASKVMALYASDAVVMPENQPAITGAAIEEYYKGNFAANTTKLTISAEETKVAGDWAFDRGQFTFELTPKAKGAKPMTEHGKYVVVLRKEAGSWKVAREIGNSNAWMTPPPAAKK